MAEREKIFKNSETAPTIYVNSVQMGQTQYDVRLRMGIIEEADDSRIVTNVAVTVFMSWPHAKALSDLLSHQIARYEAANGPLKMGVPPTPEAPSLDATEKPEG